MRLTIIIAIISVAFASCQSDKSKGDMKTQKDKVSYSIGMDIGKNLKQNNVEVDVQFLAQGIKDILEGRQVLLADSEVQTVMAKFQQEMMEKQMKVMQQQSETNKKEGQKFLEENKKVQGVVTLPSGLQYQVIKSGNGESPKVTDKVKCHYVGKLLNGTEFDNSYTRGEPAVFPLNGVIKGWTEALQLMKVGDKWKLFIPSELAYGDQGAGQAIPPGATLIFEVELLGIEK